MSSFLYFVSHPAAFKEYVWAAVFHRGGNRQFYMFFQNVLGYTPKNTKIYQVAFLHRSKSIQVQHGYKINNERLEYLGDAVLSSMVAHLLYRKYPMQGEGFLSELRSKIVSRSNLNKLAEKIGLDQLINYNRAQQGVFKSMDGDAFEALVGAIYLEKGYDFTYKVIIDRVMKDYLDIDALANSEWNFKGRLIDWGQRNHKVVAFEQVRAIMHGPNNRRQFECRVSIDGVPGASAIDYSIKSAEQLAAEKTYKQLGEQGLLV
ncbi:MAG: ribonuclease III [Bacteroidales bacterium]|nr:ribonuclease III [Candidatus Colimorpha pelethequi]